mgnify:CR=1 FL=1
MKLKNYIFGIIGVLLFIAILAFADTYQTRYTQYATVLSVNENETFFVDAIGDVWSIYNTDYHKDEIVKIKFFNNCTDYTRTDDVILKVKRVR